MDYFYDELADALAARRDCLDLLNTSLQWAADYDAEAHRVAAFNGDAAVELDLIKNRDRYYADAVAFRDDVATAEAVVDELLTERAGRVGLLLVLA